MMSPGEAQHLRSALERARQRLDYTRKERQRFEAQNEGDPSEARVWRKLKEDERKAETDIGWLQHMLGQGL
jgi:hypothetical protein